MSETLVKINQKILNSIQESKNRLRILGEEMNHMQAEGYQNTQLMDRLEQVLKHQN
jgi:polysaccharide deacetylase 2 family uncharacterized protein YibQ